MSIDFNELVADVARANIRCERAASLLIEAQCAHDDAVAAQSDAEVALNRAIAAECTIAIPRARSAPAASPMVISMPRVVVALEPPKPAFKRRCSMCRMPGHRSPTCPSFSGDMVATQRR